MKLQERYSTLKKCYKDSLILIKSGLFYITYDEDAYLLNYLFDYQVIDNKVGFPSSKIDSVKEELKKCQINVYISDTDEFIQNNENKYVSIVALAHKNYFNELNIKVLLEEISFLLHNNQENIIKVKNFINELWFYSFK